MRPRLARIPFITLELASAPARVRPSGLLPVAALLMTAPLGGVASASDGVLEINQTCAIQTGCFAGDAPGFPVTIGGTAGRSYRLTSDLVVSNENTDAIQVGADGVAIDLGGFEIRGPVVCSGLPLVCTPSSGVGSGVERTSSALAGLSVRNGSIRGMGLYGVLLGVQAQVADLRVRSNRFHGIDVGSGSTVSGSAAYQNGSSGILTGSGSSVSGSSAHENGSTGISANAGSAVSDCSAHRNGGSGIRASSGATVSASSAHANGGDGIVIFTSNGDGGALVHANSASSNAGVGLNLASQAGYRENVVSNNAAGTVTGGVNLGNNACNGSATCP